MTPARRLRVLHVTPEFPPVIWGGLGTAVGGLVSACSHAGMEVAVLLVGGPLVLDERAYGGGWRPVARRPGDEEGVPTERDVRFFQVAPEAAGRLGRRLARRWRPDVIHLHSAWLWPVARGVRDRCGAPIVFTIHSLDRAEYEIGRFETSWSMQEEVMDSADRLIALSRSERALLLSYSPSAEARLRIVGNGIDDLAPFERAAGRDEVLILYSGRFVDRKGIRELLAAIPEVLAREARARFVLVGGYGGGPEIERSWMSEVLKPFLSRVHFTGWLAPGQVADWYRAADVLVVPSWYEPFGMVVLEGMLHGLALVACDVGGPAEILEDERTALLVKPKDAGALAGALIRLVRDDALRARLAREAAREVRASWLWPCVIGQMAAVYGEVVGRRAAGGTARGARA